MLQDADSSGALDEAEVKQQLREWQGTDAVSDNYVSGVFKAFDQNGDGLIDLREFELLYSMVQQEHDEKFDKLDRGDAEALEAEPPAMHSVIHRDETPPKWIETGGAIVCAVVILLIALGFLVFSGKEVGAIGGGCSGDPCQNEARCADLVIGSNEDGTDMLSFSCVCMAGYSGSDCADDVNECDSTPCDNGGACTEGIDEYTCDCQPGFDGNRCQTDIDECHSRPCANRGACDHQATFVAGYSETADPEPGTYSCTCAGGFGGENCEVVQPSQRFFSLRSPCTTTDCATARTVSSPPLPSPPQTVAHLVLWFQQGRSVAGRRRTRGRCWRRTSASLRRTSSTPW